VALSEIEGSALESEVHEVLDEEGIAGGRKILGGAKDLVVGTLHDVLLKLDGVLDVDVVVLVERDQLELGVELGYPVERQEAQQVEAQNLVLVRRRRDVLEQPAATATWHARRRESGEYAAQQGVSRTCTRREVPGVEVVGLDLRNLSLERLGVPSLHSQQDGVLQNLS
jgi:hypothetical protein